MTRESESIGSTEPLRHSKSTLLLSPREVSGVPKTGMARSSRFPSRVPDAETTGTRRCCGTLTTFELLCEPLFTQRKRHTGVLNADAKNKISIGTCETRLLHIYAAVQKLQLERQQVGPQGWT